MITNRYRGRAKKVILHHPVNHPKEQGRLVL